MKTRLILFFALVQMSLFSQKNKRDYVIKYLDKSQYECMITKDTLYFNICGQKNTEELKTYMVSFFGQERLNQFNSDDYKSKGMGIFHFYAGRDSKGNPCFKTVSCSNTISADSCQMLLNYVNKHMKILPCYHVGLFDVIVDSKEQEKLYAKSKKKYRSDKKLLVEFNFKAWDTSYYPF